MFLGGKGETPEIFKTFARRAQREYNSPIVKIRSDNGTEFKNIKIENGAMKRESSMSFPPPKRLNKMEWWKERTRHSPPYLEQCWMIMARPRCFGRKQSTRRVMDPTECILTDASRKLQMSSSPGRNQIYPTFESLVANASSIRRKGS